MEYNYMNGNGMRKICGRMRERGKMWVLARNGAFWRFWGCFGWGGEGRSGGVAMPPKVGSETLRVSLRNPKGFEANP